MNVVIFRDKKLIFREKNVYRLDGYNIRLFLDEILRIKNFYYVPPTFEFAGFFLFVLFVFFCSGHSFPYSGQVKAKETII